MSRLALALVVALLTVATACRGSEGAAADAGAVEPDGVDGTGCTPRTPRSVPLEAFVGPTGLQARITSAIDSAQSTLDVHMYLFTVKDIADHIVTARQRGVTVRVILDPDEAGNAAVTGIFNTGGIQWLNASRVYSYAHAKYVLIDRTTALVMSMNFNADAMVRERNYGFVDRDPEDVTDLRAIFDQDWQLAQGTSGPPANLECTRLIVSPVNASQRIYDFINSATSTLDVEVLYITDATIRNAVGAAHDRGATVRLIMEDPSDTASNAGITTFMQQRTIPVRYAVDQFYLHAKLLIADGVAFVGSENMSSTSLSQNREVGGLVLEPEQVAVIQAQFDADWAITTPAY
jgi:cardiolipin synthase